MCCGTVWHWCFARSGRGVLPGPASLGLPSLFCGFACDCGRVGRERRLWFTLSIPAASTFYQQLWVCAPKVPATDVPASEWPDRRLGDPIDAPTSARVALVPYSPPSRRSALEPPSGERTRERRRKLGARHARLISVLEERSAQTSRRCSKRGPSGSPWSTAWAPASGKYGAYIIRWTTAASLRSTARRWVLLHGCEKHSKKTRQADLDFARRRKAQMERRR